MDTNQAHIGHVVRFIKEPDFGFIEAEDGEIYFFFRDKSSQKKLKQAGLIPYVHNFISGDRVSFKLRLTQRDEGKIKAYDIAFIKNERRAILINNFQENGFLDGYIKIFDPETIFVKDKSTYVYVPIVISAWEENLEEVYQSRENTLVRYKLNQVVRTDKLTATLTDAIYIDEYYEFMSHYDNQTPIRATITGWNKDGYHASLFNGKIVGFIKCNNTITSDSLGNLNRYRKGEMVEVLVNYKLRDQKRVSLIFI